MQETTTRTSQDEDPSVPRPQWVRIVAIAVALAMLAGFVIAAVQSVTGSETEPVPDGGLGGASEPDFSLTDEEALRTFDALSTTVRKAVQQRDVSLLALSTTPGGNTSERLQEEVKLLKRDGVIDLTEVETQDTEILVSDQRQIKVREVVRLFPCFQSESGKDVTEADAIVEQTGIWTLRLADDRWLVDDTQLESDRVIDGESARCRG